MPDLPAPWTPPPVRQTLSVRILPEHKAALEGFVAELQATERFKGIKPGHVLEHLVRDLLTEEGRERVRRELSGQE